MRICNFGFFPNKRLDQVKAVSMLGYFTGLRYLYLEKLNRANITEKVWGLLLTRFTNNKRVSKY